MDAIRWEYEVFVLATMKQALFAAPEVDAEQYREQLNKLGAAGWEMISVVGVEVNGYSRQLVAVFKRPVQPDPAPPPLPKD